MKKKNIVSSILIIAGTIVFSYPFVAQGYTKYQQKQLTKEYEQLLLENMQNQEETNDSNATEEKLSDYNEVRDMTIFPKVVDMKELLPELEQAEKDSQGSTEKANDVKDFLSRQDIIGMIEIEKIDIKMIIVEGTEWDNIRVTIGHMKQTEQIGEEGNCALAGHRGGTYGTFFKEIDQLEVGDEIVLTDIKGNIFSYKVYNQYVTEPTDMKAVDDVPGEKTLTLISCEDNGKKRLIIHAKMD